MDRRKVQVNGEGGFDLKIIISAKQIQGEFLFLIAKHSMCANIFGTKCRSPSVIISKPNLVMSLMCDCQILCQSFNNHLNMISDQNQSKVHITLLRDYFSFQVVPEGHKDFDKL
eukprot:TRINITY_DN4321_c2_g1_i1.p1 TRINITY_DN4321_c2_g1~~TRINITY_DN4321_c2_g1_i1.p1  ORF type:complete len:114 (-),score=3.49 TRINITY_DN4321_c2_g1_i1:177-518(-)